VVTSRNVVSHKITQDFVDAQGSPAAGSADVHMINEVPVSPRVSSGPPQLVVGCDVGIPVEIFIVGAQEIQWKIHTQVSSLGRSNDYVVVVISNLSKASSCFCAPRHVCDWVTGCDCLMFTCGGAGKHLERPCTTMSLTWTTCWSRLLWMVSS
jgi:hypothetical protein